MSSPARALSQLLIIFHVYIPRQGMNLPLFLIVIISNILQVILSIIQNNDIIYHLQSRVPLFIFLFLLTVTGGGSMGVPSVPEDCQVRVFGPSVLVDISYNFLSIWNIPLSGLMYICSHYLPFSSQALLACHRKTFALATSP